MNAPDLLLERSLVVFQASVTLGIAGLFLALFLTYRKRYFGIWGGAWSVYALRLVIIAVYLTTRNPIWLFWHQVATGWTTLLLLWAALVFARQLSWDHRYYLLFAVPVLWSYVAIYRIQNFLWAALPAVVFLSLATLGTGVVFLQYWRRAASKGAAVLAVAFLLWGAHHLDYTMLRARGAWVPYGYYLDLLFELAVGGGMLLLVLEDQHRGMAALSTLSGDLQRSLRPAEVVAAVLERPLALPPVIGCALYREDDAGTLGFRGGSGACAHWGETALATAGPGNADAEPLLAAPREGAPRVEHYWPRAAGADPRLAPHPYAAFLPVFTGERAAGTFVIVARARDPFASMDREFLRALGQQIGAALQHADLYAALETRSRELARASASLLRAAEVERGRIARELHDETGQVLTAIKLELGELERSLAGAGISNDAVERARQLAGRALESIRATARGLRPAVLDDLGLVPAIRALAEDFAGRTGVAVNVSAGRLPARLAPEVEVALYRVFQEALTNVARHAAASRVDASLAPQNGELLLVVQDDGRGFQAPAAGGPEAGHAGLAGMRERVVGAGGRFAVTSAPGHGVRLEARLPVGANDG
ncbi:MAG TPA: GAF domain-containing sensor histidine kinase [Gemmatimonadales bacterium]|nr:GAF domain-containing sensor histidine kinase [Gemmatimonadales bacterium]